MGIELTAKRTDNMNLNKKSKILKTFIQISPLIMIGICIAIYFIYFKGISVEKILAFTPENLFIAALVIWGLFALKSMSFIFPMMILQIASGAIFPNVFVAIIVNIIGILIQITLPYLIGRYAERELVEGLINKNKNSKKLNEIKSKNEWFIAYFLRVINMLPCDLVSMFLGSVGFSPLKYYVGSMLGILPGMIATTVVGAKISDPTSPMFFIALAVDMFFAVSSAVSYKIYKQKHIEK